MQAPDRLQGGEEVRELRPWLNRLRDFAASLTPSGSGGIRVQRLAGGCFFSMDRQSNSGGSYPAQTSGEYEGAFAVVSSGDGLVKVLSYNADEGREWEALVYAGLEKIAVTETEISAAAGSHVWLELTWSGSAYEYDIKAGELPAQTSALYVVPLAYVAESGITQMQFGNIYVAGRVV